MKMPELYPKAGELFPVPMRPEVVRRGLKTAF